MDSVDAVNTDDDSAVEVSAVDSFARDVTVDDSTVSVSVVKSFAAADTDDV